MKKIRQVGIVLALWFFKTVPVWAQEPNADISGFTNSTLQIITLIATASAVFFLVKSGYIYITSAGKPEALISAKTTFRNALIGLVLVLGANMLVSVFRQALTGNTMDGGGQVVEMQDIGTAEPSDGLTQVLIDAVAGFIQNIVESATEPIVNGVVGFLTTTPSVLNNSVIKNFWLVCVGIVDSLFVIVVALTGLQVMSATTFGFEGGEIKQALPRIGLGFLGANVSLFLADYVIVTGNALVTAILNSTGGLNQAFITDAISPASLLSGTTPLIVLIFLVLFLIVSIVLLLLYISRLIIIGLGAVLSPFVFLLWSMPKTAGTAEMAIKSYVVTVLTVFVHVVIIQLGSSFLSLPEHNENSLISIAVAIGLFATMLKTPSLMMQLVMYTANNETLKKFGSQVINVISTDKSSAVSNAQAKISKKVVRI